MSPYPLRTLLVSLASLTLVPIVHAHDFWIEPQAFQINEGHKLQVELQVGHAFHGDRVARDVPRIEYFEARRGDERLAIDGEHGGLPAGTVTLQKPGVHVLTYRSRHAFSYLRPPAFESYLREEGLEHIITKREQASEAERIGLESYSRCSKSLVTVGPSHRLSGYQQQIGLPLELTPVRSPWNLHPGDSLPIRVTYQGKPLEGVLVEVHQREDEGFFYQGRSDEKGLIRFKVSGSGTWLVSCVHMVRAPEDVKGDWESFWASLTFDTRVHSHGAP